MSRSLLYGVVISLFLSIVAPVPVCALQNNRSSERLLEKLQKYEKAEAQRATKNESFGNEGEGFYIWIFLGLSFLVLYCVLTAAETRRKQLVSEEKDKKKERKKPVLTGLEKSIGMMSLGALILIFVITLFAGTWLFLGLVLSVFFVLLLKFPVVISAIYSELQTVQTSNLEGNTRKTFKDLGGLEEHIFELKECVRMLKNPDRATQLGARSLKGTLLVGPPGTGKTLIAKAIAGEAGVPFFSKSGPEFVQFLMGSGSYNVSSLFQQARQAAPSIIYIDEIDALGKQRGFSNEHDNAVNQLLVEIDGISELNNVFLLASTNREDVLDPALVRPGRFDRKTLIPYPNTAGRKEILTIHTANKPLATDVNLDDLARATLGFSGAALEQLTNESALIADRRLTKEMISRGYSEEEDFDTVFLKEEIVITKHDFDEAFLRPLGVARKNVMSKTELQKIAYHELGHAVVTAHFGIDMLKQVAIVTRDWAAGLTVSTPEEQHLHAKNELLARIGALMGGRAAEKVFLGDEKITTGAANDLEKADEIARNMVCEWGMGELLVIHRINKFQNGSSGFVNERVEKEVATILDERYKEACTIVENYRDTISSLSVTLMEKMTLDAEEIYKALKKASLSPLPPPPVGGWRMADDV
jgi:cell division protease FtsH